MIDLPCLLPFHLYLCCMGSCAVATGAPVIHSDAARPLCLDVHAALKICKSDLGNIKSVEKFLQPGSHHANHLAQISSAGKAIILLQL